MAPKTDYTNKMYGGTNIKGHNIFFANAEEDPWQWAGMREVTNPKKYPTIQAEMINCTNCGHCVDFHTPTDTQPIELTNVQTKIAETITQWLQEAALNREEPSHAHDRDVHLLAPFLQ